MQAKEIMTTSVKTVTPDTPLMEALSLICLYRHSGLPVLEDGRLVGIINEKDIMVCLLPDAGALMNNGPGVDLNSLMREYTGLIRLLHVGDLMNTDTISVTPETHVLQAAVLMADKRVRRVAVARGGILLGTLSLGDVHKAIFHESIATTRTAA